MMRLDPLSADNILRRLPSIIDAQCRLRIDAQVHGHDVMVNALSRLTVACAGFNPQRPSPGVVAAMFADAWSIVDQIDMIRQVIEATKADVGPVTSGFLARAAEARRMRNQMDHLSQRIPNIAGRTGRSEALFGAISFVRCSINTLAAATPGAEIDGEVVIVARGTVPAYDGAAKSTFSTHDINRPVSNLRLNAADCSLQLDSTISTVTDLLEGLSADVAASIDAQIPDLARQTGMTEWQLRFPTPTIVVAACAVSFPFGTEEALAVPSDAVERPETPV